MGIVFLASGNLWVLAWQEPHVKLATALDAHAGLDVVGNLGGINERNVQCLCHMTRCYDIGSMSIYQGIAVDELLAVILLVAQLLIIIILQFSGIIATAHYGIEKYRNTALGTGLVHVLGEIGVKGGTWIGMTVWLRLFVVMSELDEDIIARLNLVQYLLPAALVEEAQGRATVDGMIVYDDLVIETTLQNHSPASLRTRLVIAFSAAVESPITKMVVVFVLDVIRKANRKTHKIAFIFFIVL